MISGSFAPAATFAGQYSRTGTARRRPASTQSRSIASKRRSWARSGRAPGPAKNAPRAAVAEADAACVVGVVPAVPDEQRLLSIAWASETGDGRSHYLAGNPPFDLAWCRAALAKAGVLDGTVWEVA